jgi:hypothetical protein
MTTQHDQALKDAARWKYAAEYLAVGLFQGYEGFDEWSGERIDAAIQADKDAATEPVMAERILGYRIGTAIFAMHSDAMAAQRFGPNEGKKIIPLVAHPQMS